MASNTVHGEARTDVHTNKKNKVVQRIAEKSGLSQKNVALVFISLFDVINEELSESGSGECRIPYIGVKLKRVLKAASKARTMLSPLTGKMVNVPAKPARTLIKLITLKPLKDLFNKAS